MSPPSEFPYGSFANYSPRGTLAESQRSRIICGNLKAGRRSQIELAIPRLAEPEAAVLHPFLNPQVTLVPVPRSAPLVEGALWPSLVIAQVLQEAGYGQSVQPLLERVKAVPKSSSSSKGDERPLIDVHHASLKVRKDLLSPAQITLVDDVLTMGRTTFACASLLQDAFPSATLRIFAMLRTQGKQPEIDAVFDPSVGTVTGYESGKAWRDP